MSPALDTLEARADLRAHWGLDPAIVHLNHASYGACPRQVLTAQSALRDELERQPGAFFADLPSRLRDARVALGRFIGASPAQLALTSNVTYALNAAIGSLALSPGDEIVITDHEYNATHQIVLERARATGATCVVAHIPFVGADDDAVVDAVLDAITPRTRFAVIDHVTSQTGLVLPIERLVAGLRDHGVDVVVDGAHAPGMLDLDVESIGAAWYAGNCHKWLCAPKSAGFLWARADLIGSTRSAIVSHGAGIADPQSRFEAEFDWPGTLDPTAALCAPVAIDFLASIVEGGWPAIRRGNHALIEVGRRIVCDALGIDPPCDAGMLGCMATLPLPDNPAFGASNAKSALDRDPLRARLLEEFGIEVPVFRCGAHDGRLIRISAALYNTRSDYAQLAEALGSILRS